MLQFFNIPQIRLDTPNLVCNLHLNLYNLSLNIQREVVNLNAILIWREWLVAISITVLICLIYGILKRYTLKHTVILSSFYVYLTSLVCLTFLPFPVRQTPLSFTALKEGVDLVPIKPLLYSWGIVQTYLDRGDTSPLKTFLWNNIGNLLVLMPLAVFLYTYFKKNFTTSLLLSFFTSVTIELLQAAFCMFFGVLYRVIDINDIILNTAGALLVLIVVALSRKLKDKSRS